jgi:hypothetical protein
LFDAYYVQIGSSRASVLLLLVLVWCSGYLVGSSRASVLLLLVLVWLPELHGWLARYSYLEYITLFDAYYVQIGSSRASVLLLLVLVWLPELHGWLARYAYLEYSYLV